MIRTLLLLTAAVPAFGAIVITGAQVADGTGAPLRRADVRIEGDRIVSVGRVPTSAGDRVINGAGLVLAPGFIDTHNHSMEALDKQPGVFSQVSQGITTIVLGQDGGSAWPIGEWLDARRQHPAAVNVLTLIGHATIRREVMGDDFRRSATAEEVARMAKLVEQAMGEGAVGLSTGLEYEVGSYSTTEEVIALARAAAKQHGIYVSHVRDEADKTFDAFREILRIGDEAQLPVQISHIKLGTLAVWGKADEAVRLIEQARAHGLDVTADWYPYDAWSSTITVLVPDKKYDNPVSVRKALDAVGGAKNITITRCEKHRDYEMRKLDEVARALKVSAVDLYIQIVKDGGAGIVCKAMTEADMRTFLQQPWVMVASDGGVGMRHPRGAGTFPRVLGRMVREQHWLTLPEAIRKMTSLPAGRYRLTDRGVIREGAFADLVLLDPKTVIDRATFEKPLELSEGIRTVFVNGEVVWDSGKSTGVLPGRVLR